MNTRTSCYLFKASSVEDKKKYTHKNVPRASGLMLVTLYTKLSQRVQQFIGTSNLMAKIQMNVRNIMPLPWKVFDKIIWMWNQY